MLLDFLRNDYVKIILVVLLFAYVFNTTMKRFRDRKRSRIAAKSAAINFTGTKRADGSFEEGEIVYANGNIYSGQFNSKNQFHGIGLYAYKVPDTVAKKLDTQAAALRKTRITELWSKYRKDKADFDKLTGHRLFKKFDSIVFKSDHMFIGYVGHFSDGFQHGYGREFTANDQAFEGRFVLGSRSGYGCQVYSCGDEGVYAGGWQNDKKQDEHGVFYFGSKGLASLVGARYEGSFANGVREGDGELIYPDGRRVTQTFHLGKDVTTQRTNRGANEAVDKNNDSDRQTTNDDNQSDDDDSSNNKDD